MTPGPRWGRYYDGATELQRFGTDSNRSIVLLDSNTITTVVVTGACTAKSGGQGFCQQAKNPFGPHGCQRLGGLLSWSPHGPAVVALYL